jgi:hypothetical protein
VRRYGLYSSRSCGTWSGKPWLVRLAHEGWLEQHPQQPPLSVHAAFRDNVEPSASTRASRSAFHGTPWSWARLLAKVCEVDAVRCSRCGSPMKVLAVITDPSEIRRTLLNLIKNGVAPPGLEASALN